MNAKQRRAVDRANEQADMYVKMLPAYGYEFVNEMVREQCTRMRSKKAWRLRNALNKTPAWKRARDEFRGRQDPTAQASAASAGTTHTHAFQRAIQKTFDEVTTKGMIKSMKAWVDVIDKEKKDGTRRV